MKAWIVSVLLHGAVAVGALFWVPVDRPSRPPDPGDVEVVFHGRAAKSGSKSEATTARGAVGRGTVQKRIPGLGVEWFGRSIAPRGDTTIGGDPRPAGGGRLTGDGAHAVARSMSAEREAKLYPFFEELRLRLDDALDYPKEFTDLDLDGSVDVELEVDSRGVFTGKLIRASGSDEALKTYAVAMAVRAFQDPVPAGRLRGWPEGVASLPVAVHVDFELQGHGDAKPARESFRLKNVYHLARRSQVEPKLNREFAKVRKWVPLLYFPGWGFAIDFVAAYRLIHEWGDTDPKTLSRERLQSSRESWSRLVVKPVSSPRP